MGPRRILVHRVSTSIFSRTRAPLESSRRCCRRWRDKSSLSLLGSLSQADTRELTDRTVAIKPPKRIRTLHATTVPMVALRYPCAGRRTAGDNKRTRARTLARGMRHKYRQQPRHDAHEEDPLRCGRVVRPQ